MRDDQRQPIQCEEHPQRGDERGDADPGDEEAVDGAAAHRHEHRQDQTGVQPQAEVVEHMEHERREQVHRPDGEVDLAEDHYEHLARRDDGQRREVGQQRLEGVALDEVVGADREVGERHQGDDDDAALAQREKAPDQLHCARAKGPARFRAPPRTRWRWLYFGSGRHR